MIMEKDIVYSQIMFLKAYKRKIPDDHCAKELVKASGYLNIIDMLLLPLYYCWDQFGYGTLEEVRFEVYLKRAYRRFSRSMVSYTNQLIVLLRNVYSNIRISRNCILLIVPLIGIFEEMLSIYLP